MEVKTSNVVMESSEQLQEKQFTIATNAKAFEILTSTLYKNVPSSIVRELNRLLKFVILVVQWTKKR